MLLKKIYIHQFRNYIDTKIDLSNSITIFLGKNGQGKTNVLEAIFCLVFGRSFRVKKIQDLISWDYDEAFLQARIESDGNSRKFELDFLKNLKDKRKHRIDDFPVKTFEYLGQFNAVLFQPEDLNMVEHEPSLRRRYMDMLLSQVDSEYAYKLLKYSKVIKVRNKLLQDIKFGKSSKDEIVFWDKTLIDYGSYIIEKRLRLLDFINTKSSNLYSDISAKDFLFKLQYDGFYKDINISKIDIEKAYKKVLDSKFEFDLMTGYTSIGPHRDDFKFFLNKKEMRTFASRGEYRSAILVLKILEVEYIKEMTGKTPILLLDDVFSELDEKRREYLLKIVLNQQTIVSATEIGDALSSLDKKDVIVYEVSSGIITKNK